MSPLDRGSEKSLVVGLGEILWDVFPDHKRLGGAPANFAYHAARQGFAGTVVSAVGDDTLGREIETILAEKNLPALLPRRSAQTGRVDISLDENGVASYVFAENCAWDDIPFLPEPEALARRAAAVCFGSLAQRDARSRATILRFLDCVPANSIRVFDINLRQNFFSKNVLADSLARATILKVNEDEFPVLAEVVGLPKNISVDEFFLGIFEKCPRLERWEVALLHAMGNVHSFPQTRVLKSLTPLARAIRSQLVLSVRCLLEKRFLTRIATQRTSRILFVPAQEQCPKSPTHSASHHK